jgi:hypothetical protein
MIRLQKYTPDVYYEQSRDFQFLGRLYDITLNSVKTNADIIKFGLPFNSQSPRELLGLLARTLGFKPKRQYSHAQLLAVCCIFSEILKNKGNIKAVQLIGDVILRTEGVIGTIACFMSYDEVTNTELPKLRIMIPAAVNDIALFYDLLEYIVPAGCLVEILRGDYTPPISAGTEVESSDTITVLKELDGNLIPRSYRYKVPTQDMSLIQQNIDKYNQTVIEPSRSHIANAFVWKRGNRRKPLSSNNPGQGE